MSNQQQAPEGQKINITDEQMVGAIQGGLKFLNLETTLIPGNLKKQLAVLEVVLVGLSQGAMVIASPDQLAVKSPPEDIGSNPVSDAVKAAALALATGAGAGAAPADKLGDEGAETHGSGKEKESTSEKPGVDTSIQEG